VLLHLPMAAILKLVWDADVRRVHVSELTYDQVQAAVLRVFPEELTTPGEEEAFLLEFRDEEASRTVTRESFPDLVVLHARQQQEHQRKLLPETMQRALRLYVQRLEATPQEMASQHASPPLVRVKTELEEWAPRSIPTALQAVKKELLPEEILGGRLQAVKEELPSSSLPMVLSSALRAVKVKKEEETEERTCISHFRTAAVAGLLPVKLEDPGAVLHCEDPRAVRKAARELLRQARKAELQAARMAEKQRHKDAKVAEKLAKQARKMRRKVAKRIEKLARRVARRAKRAFLLAKRKGEKERVRTEAAYQPASERKRSLEDLAQGWRSEAEEEDKEEDQELELEAQPQAQEATVLDHGGSIIGAGDAKRSGHCCEALLRRKAAKAARKEIKRRLRDFRKKARKGILRSHQRRPADDTDYRASGEDTDAAVEEEAGLTPLAEPPAADDLSEELQGLVEFGFRGFLEAPTISSAQAEAAVVPGDL